MSTSADRRMRGARNVLIDLLGLGHPALVVDLPVTAVPRKLAPGEPLVPATTTPVMVPFGGGATIVIDDAEPGVTYRLRASGAGTSLSHRRVEGEGGGGRLDLIVPRIDESVTFTVEATRGKRTAMLGEAAPVMIGIDPTIPIAIKGFEATAALLDYGVSATIVLEHSQEAVAYSLVLRPTDDPSIDDPAAFADDPPIGGIMGKGGSIELVSAALTDDAVIRVRADRSYGKGQRQTTWLDARLPVHVRADRMRAVTLSPSVSEHGAPARVMVAIAQQRVRYDVLVAGLADAAFSPGLPRDASAVGVDADGRAIRVAMPQLGPLWRSLPGFAPAAASGTGAGRDLAIVTPPLIRDSAIVVRAVKRHGDGDAAFESAVPMATPVVALVRPSSEPLLTIEAAIEGAKLVGLRIEGGQPGVFYAITAGADRLGELYVHQVDPSDAARNKGVGQIALGIDFAVAADLAQVAPPPVPRLDCPPRDLPATLAITARRATTGLGRALANSVTIAPAPSVSAAPAVGAVGTNATITVEPVAATASYVLMIDRIQRGEPVPGTTGPLTLATGPLAAGARVELLIRDGTGLQRRIAIPLRIG